MSSLLTSSTLEPRLGHSSGQGRLQRTKILVAIVCYGSKNLEFLKGLISDYRAMELDLDIVVTSNDPKDLGPGVEVIVGLPTRNPWSLPFAHKKVFADRVNRYDLFIYSEDDVGLTRDQMSAYLEVSDSLGQDEIPGYLRYECDSEGRRSLPDMHGAYRWRLETVQRRGNLIVAEYTNLHAGVYVVTRRQLKRAIAHGSYLRRPVRGEFDLACTAATDPYTQCGLRKVICLSRIDDFLLHHRSNRYSGKMGISEPEFLRQVEIVKKVAEGTLRPQSLGLSDPHGDNHRWAKAYDETVPSAIIDQIPVGARTALTVGGGNGYLERALRARGLKVCVLPLDVVAGAGLATVGAEVVEGDLANGLRQLSGRSFDVVIAPNLLHLTDEPRTVLGKLAQLTEWGGTLVASGPHFSSAPMLVNRLLGRKGFARFRSLRKQGITPCKPANLTRELRSAHFGEVSVRWEAKKGGILISLLNAVARRWCSMKWTLVASKMSHL